MPRSEDEAMMRAALAEGERGLGATSPNPAVGAVLAIRGKIAARGFHKRAGSPHAEIECLTSFRGKMPPDATFYVTLEPCSTTGRTGACTEAIIKSAVPRVVIGATDPNPQHAGRGIEILRRAGIDVEVGVLADDCTALNESFNKWIVTRQPFVIAKCGTSLDGRLTRPPEEANWITSAAARRHAQTLRARVDAILVGAETVRTDDPRLTVRGRPGARQPWRVVLSRSGRLPRDAKLFTDRHADRTLVFRNKSLAAVLRELGGREITSVLIEGGGDVLGEALDARLIDRVQIYVGAMFTGGPVPAFARTGVGSPHSAAGLNNVSYEQIGDDICITGGVSYEVAREGENGETLPHVAS